MHPVEVFSFDEPLETLNAQRKLAQGQRLL